MKESFADLFALSLAESMVENPACADVCAACMLEEDEDGSHTPERMLAMSSRVLGIMTEIMRLHDSLANEPSNRVEKVRTRVVESGLPKYYKKRLLYYMSDGVVGYEKVAQTIIAGCTAVQRDYAVAPCVEQQA